MTTKEIYFKYKEIFILVMESVAETQNPIYKDSEKIINEHEKYLLAAIDQGAPFEIVMLDMIATIVVAVNGIDRVDDTEITDYMESIFELYLKRPTRSFCTQNGIPVIDAVNYKSYIKKISKDGRSE